MIILVFESIHELNGNQLVNTILEISLGLGWLLWPKSVKARDRLLIGYYINFCTFDPNALFIEFIDFLICYWLIFFI